jgi:hypothetical protein
MPIFPIVAILGAYGAVELGRALVRAGRLRTPVAMALIAGLMLTQSVVAVIHNDRVLSRPDTRNTTRDWMVRNVPPGAKIVIEPVVPDTWATDIGTSLQWTPSGERWFRYATWLSAYDEHGNLLPAGQRRYVVIDQYERSLQPALLEQYLKSGYCWVIVGSLQAGRAFAAPQDVPQSIAYYSGLARNARLAYHLSPFGPGARAVPFSFDWSIDYYPPQYRYPGPEMSVYQLSGGKCASWNGSRSP